MTARPLLIGVVAIVAFALGLFLARSLTQPPVGAVRLAHATAYPAQQALPALPLVDQHGRPLAADYFTGHWTVVFFGFTQCPDVCPTTLATLARLTASLADLPEAEQPRVLLISVDPERDKPPVLARYVRSFDPAFHGATGDAAGVAAATAAFGVPYAKVGLAAGGYSMDHGAGVFIVGPDGSIRAYSSAPHDAVVLGGDYRRLVAASRSSR